MLITLQSNNDSDAAEFVNYFRETVMIEPKSEISLVNISYKFKNGVTILTGVNDTFDVSIGRDNDYATCVIPQGEYATIANFVSVCNLALAAGIATMEYWQQQAFKNSSQTFSLEATDKLKLTLQYDPENWDESKIEGALISIDPRKQVFPSPLSMIAANSTGMIKRVTGGVLPGAYNVDNWRSGYGSSVNQTNVMWATARDTDQAVPHGKIAWKGYRTASVDWVVGMADGAMPSAPADWAVGSTKLAIAVRCEAGALKVEERDGSGALALIATLVPSDHQNIEIHFDQIKPTSAATYAKYYINGVQQTIPGAPVRYQLTAGADLMPVGSLKTPTIVDSVIDGDATYLIPGCITGFDFTAGSGYLNGEIVSVEGASGSKTTLLATTNSSGQILTLSFQEHGGDMVITDTGLAVTGLMSGATNATFDTTSVADSVTISTPGSSYRDLPAGNNWTLTPGPYVETYDTVDLGDIATYRRTRVGGGVTQWWQATSPTDWKLYNTKPVAGQAADNTATINAATGVITYATGASVTPTGGVPALISYTVAVADIIHNGITYPGAVDIVAVNADGAITDFRWVNLFVNLGVSAGDTMIIKQGDNQTCTITINAVNAESNIIYDVITDTIKRDIDEPLGLHNRASFRPSDGFTSTTSMTDAGPAPAIPLEETASNPAVNDREDSTMLVNIEEFQIKSICKRGGVQKAIASVPYGLTQPYYEGGDPVKVEGEFYYEPYNTLYHDLSNPGVENHNQLRVRLTDSVGNPMVQMKHPTTVTIDLRPRAK